MKLLKPPLSLARVNSLLFSSFLFLSLSCAKLTYVTQQGWGQFKIQWQGRDYQEVLEDPKVSEAVKEKIRKIQTYKDYFYKYFEKNPTSIYSEVTFLDREAVTHLVIASIYNKIEPKKEWFPFVGEFPYLGFFDEESALDHAKDLEEEDYYTYVRPVYAYSSLGNFEDKILSSFFIYEDEELAELIFHELFHTVFFIKDNVELNENLANYFGKQMMYEYFKVSSEKQSENLKQFQKNEELRIVLVKLVQEYKNELEAKSPKNKKESDALLADFIEKSFKPRVQKACKEIRFKNCYPLSSEWNNARFAAYMTYEKKANFIESLQKKNKFNLKQLFNYLVKKYKEHEKRDIKTKFEAWIETQ